MRTINLNHAIVALKVIIVLLMFTSCTPTKIYTNASTGALKSYKAKQEYRGVDTSAVYVSSNLGFGTHINNGELEEDKKVFLEAGIHRSITRRNYNVSYGVSGSYGTYNFKAGPLFDTPVQVENLGKKEFYTIQPFFSYNVNIPTEKFDWRILGVELAYNYEFGSYQDTLEDLKNRNLSGYFIYNQKSILHFNLNSEVLLKLDDVRALSAGAFFGDVINKNDELKGKRTSYFGVNLAFKYKKWTFNFLRQNSRTNASASDKSTRFGLTYQLF